MTGLALVGRVGAAWLRREVRSLEGGGQADAARFLLDLLEAPQIAAIVNECAGDTELSAALEMRIPAAIAKGHGIAEQFTTDKSTVWFRNRLPGTGKKAWLLASAQDDRRESLAELSCLGASEIMRAVDLWVQTATIQLDIADAVRDQLEAALSGLLEARTHSATLALFSRFVAEVAAELAEGKVCSDALGRALHVLRLPRDTTAFGTIKERERGWRSAWKRRWEQLYSDRAPLLLKLQKSRQTIERTDLQRQFKNIRDEIPTIHHLTVENFIAAPAQWCVEAEEFARIEWDLEHTSQLFTGLRTAADIHIAERTRRHFEDRDPKRLTDDDAAYLKALSARRVLRDPDPDDRSFLERHSHFLGEDPGLRTQWDRFIYGTSVTCTDLLVGVLEGVERLYGRNSDRWHGEKSLELTIDLNGRKPFRDINEDAARLFLCRYKGIAELGASRFTVNWAHFSDYDTFLREEGERGNSPTRSDSRRANTVRLALRLRSTQHAHTDVVQILWMAQPDAISRQLPDDLQRLAVRPFPLLSVHPNRISSKGDLQRVSLANRDTLEPVFGKDAGALVPSRDGDVTILADEWNRALRGAVERGGVSSEQGERLTALWTRFAGCYRAALKDYMAGRNAAETAFEQANAYGDLLREAAQYLTKDRLREDIIAPLLSIGVVEIRGEAAASIIAPWHPLRMVSSAAKLRRVARFINHIMADEPVEFGDQTLFFKDFREHLVHPHAPEVAVTTSRGRATLVTVVDTLDDYSLAEAPQGAPNVWRSQADPSSSADQLLDTVDRYLDLQRHEGDNLSVALFNCDSAGLPTATVQGLADRQDDDVHCNVILRHTDLQILRRVYNDLVERSDADPDAVIASETSSNFMANLRVGIQLEAPAQPRASDGRGVDIAFLDDVIARRAQLDVAPLPHGRPPTPFDAYVPSHSSYRVPVGMEETSAHQYLACPEQTSVGREYLKCVCGVIRPPVSGVVSDYTIPVRRLLFSDEQTRLLLRQAHDLAEWVVNFDDALDPRQLRNHNIQVIRFRRDSTSGRNLIVSSTAPMGLLRILVKRRLEELRTGLADAVLHELATRFIDDATDISGEIVLRAAKRGTYAGELIGVVLSRALVREELGAVRPQSWFFLDDYATWLGRREGQIADLLALSPSFEGGPAGVVVRVTEAKYVTASGLADARKRSRSQTEETTSRLRSALFENPGRLDRDLWLSRLAELLETGLTSSTNVEAWRALPMALRQGAVTLDVRGYSHVFVSGPSDDTSISGQDLLSTSAGSGAMQEVFGPSQVRELVLRYARRESLVPVRKSLGNDRPWEKWSFEAPANRPSWHLDSLTELAAPAPAPAPAPARREASREVLEVAEPPVGQVRTSARETTLADGPTKAPPGGLASTSSRVQDLIRSRGRSISSDVSSAWLVETVSRLRVALSSYDLQSTVLGSRLTPNTALIRLQGSDRLTVKDIEQRRSQLLTTHGLKIVLTAARPGEVVVSVARPEREVVSLWDVWTTYPPPPIGEFANLQLLIGLRELDGEPMYLRLTSPANGEQEHAPHTLVAGTTGSGKSVLLQNLLLDLALKNEPKAARVTIIDPKMGVDYFALERLPHLTEAVITTQERALEVLQGLVEEMERRYRLFSIPRVNKLAAYNAKVPVEERLPWLVVVHDEFADWMQSEEYRDQVTSVVNRLSVKARAAGIHLIFAAQRPDVSVMPMQLRDNLGNRLILRVEAEGASVFLLNERGAERLLGRGHIAVRLQGDDIQLAQVPWMSPEDASAVIDALTS